MPNSFYATNKLKESDLFILMLFYKRFLLKGLNTAVLNGAGNEVRTRDTKFGKPSRAI